MSAPTMEERKACWGARDEFWQCLDRHGDDASQCEKLRLSFESRCPQQWVSSSRRGLPQLVPGERSIPSRLSNSVGKELHSPSSRRQRPPLGPQNERGLTLSHR
ncbi:cytochrome c oxidase assembly factor 6 homolog isoform 1-T1 [Morphnus guianensis]